MKKKITVVTPTIRREGLDIVAKSLQNQTFKDFQWLVCSPFDYEIPEGISGMHLKDAFVENEGGFWGLNRAYNWLFACSEGDLIVTLQDWIYIPPDGLQKFWDVHEKFPDFVVSGVGDQYERVNKYGKPEVKIWSDPRKNERFGSFYECFPNDCEWNWAMIPKKHIAAVGGMDEELDFRGYGGDQLQIVERMDALGIKFYLDQSNESFTIRHGRGDFGGQQSWDGNHVVFNGEYDKRKKELIESGQWPKVPFLHW